jgi:hypothetical protein
MVLLPAKAVVDQIVRANYTDVFYGINRIGLHYNKELFFQAIQEVIWNIGDYFLKNSHFC